MKSDLGPRWSAGKSIARVARTQAHTREVPEPAMQKDADHCGPSILPLTLHDAGDPSGQGRPVEIRQRLALKALLRHFGLRAEWRSEMPVLQGKETNA